MGFPTEFKFLDNSNHIIVQRPEKGKRKKTRKVEPYKLISHPWTGASDLFDGRVIFNNGKSLPIFGGIKLEELRPKLVDPDKKATYLIVDEIQ
ncbi:914_t:CDS:2, partial [Funneliformis caledonium]